MCRVQGLGCRVQDWVSGLGVAVDFLFFVWESIVGVGLIMLIG